MLIFAFWARVRSLAPIFIYFRKAFQIWLPLVLQCVFFWFNVHCCVLKYSANAKSYFSGLIMFFFKKLVVLRWLVHTFGPQAPAICCSFCIPLDAWPVSCYPNVSIGQKDNLDYVSLTKCALTLQVLPELSPSLPLSLFMFNRVSSSLFILHQVPFVVCVCVCVRVLIPKSKVYFNSAGRLIRHKPW